MIGQIETEEQANRLVLDGSLEDVGYADYTTTIKFDTRLIKALDHAEVRTMECFMENVPIVCQNKFLRRLLWEEVQETGNKRDRVLQSKHA